MGLAPAFGKQLWLNLSKFGENLVLDSKTGYALRSSKIGKFDKSQWTFYSLQLN
jgi:hypothetical protein